MYKPPSLCSVWLRNYLWFVKKGRNCLCLKKSGHPNFQLKYILYKKLSQMVLLIISIVCSSFQVILQCPKRVVLTHCSLEMHICVSKLTIIGSDNGLSHGRRQALIWTNTGILFIGTLGNFSEILSEIHTFAFKNIRLKKSSAKWRPFCLGLNELTHCSLEMPYVDTDLGQHWIRYWLVAWQHQAINPNHRLLIIHYDDVIMTMLASQITSLTVVYSIVYSVNQRKHQSSASLAFVREIHRGPVNFPHKWPVTRKMFPFDDVIMKGVL